MSENGLERKGEERVSNLVDDKGHTTLRILMDKIHVDRSYLGECLLNIFQDRIDNALKNKSGLSNAMSRLCVVSALSTQEVYDEYKRGISFTSFLDNPFSGPMKKKDSGHCYQE